MAAILQTGMTTAYIPRPTSPPVQDVTGWAPTPWKPWQPNIPSQGYAPVSTGGGGGGGGSPGGHVEFGPGQYGEQISHGELVSVGSSVMDLQSQVAQRELQHEYDLLQHNVSGQAPSMPAGEPAPQMAPPTFSSSRGSAPVTQLEQAQAPVAAPGSMMMSVEKPKEFPWVWIVGAAIVGLLLAGRKD